MRARGVRTPPHTGARSEETSLILQNQRFDGLRSGGTSIGTPARMITRRLARFAFAGALVLSFSSPALAQNPDSDSANTEKVTYGSPSKRPALLLPLYASAVALEAMDVYTTYRGMRAGAHETNPLVRNGTLATTIALKTATAGLGIMIAEKMWKKNKAAAIAAMVATNLVTGSIVANNYRVINAQKRR
jgi:hypothetical protein